MNSHYSMVREMMRWIQISYRFALLHRTEYVCLFVLIFFRLASSSIYLIWQIESDLSIAAEQTPMSGDDGKKIGGKERNQRIATNVCHLKVRGHLTNKASILRKKIVSQCAINAIFHTIHQCYHHLTKVEEIVIKFVIRSKSLSI